MFNRLRRRLRIRNRCAERCAAHECRHAGTPAECIPLSQGVAGGKYRVSRNADAKTREMGLYPGADVHVIKNTRGDPSVVVAVGEARYVIHRDIAELIMVRLET